MEQKTLETLLVAQIVTLAFQIKADKKAHGTTTTSTCVRDAIKLIQQQRPEVLQRLAENR